MGKLVDKLPPWGKFVFYVLTAVGSVYCIAHYGFFHFLLRVIQPLKTSRTLRIIGGMGIYR